MKQLIKNILIVEDNEDYQIIIENFLRLTNFEIDKIDRAIRLTETLELVKKTPYDLIFLDIRLPDNTEITSISKILSINNDIPIIVLTGMDQFEISFEAIKLGAQDYLIKGEFDEVILEKSIIHSIERKKILNDLKDFNKKLDQKVRERTELVEGALDDLRMEINRRELVERDLISARKEIQDLYRNEKESNELRSNFITNISHQYRSPLQVIMTSSYLIEALYGNEDEKLNKFLNNIRSSVKNMIDTLDDILTIDQSGFKTEHTEYEIDACREIIGVIEDLKNINKSNDRIFCDLPEKAFIKNFDQHFSHILLNLLSNALKYSENDTKVNVVGEIIEEKIKIRIIDNGIGIPEDQLNMVFVDFFRARNSINIPGSGLGLSLVNRLVKEIDGDISVDSKEGKGTTCSLIFPLVR